MSNIKLSMAVGPRFQRDDLEAKIIVSDGDRGDFASLYSEPDGTFSHSSLSAMLRVFADRIDEKYGDQKVAA